MAMGDQQITSFVQKFRDLWVRGSLPILTWNVEGVRHGLAYTSVWATTVLVGHSKKIVVTDTEEVQVMRDVLRDERQIAQQLNKQAVHQYKLNKPSMSLPMRWAK